MAEQKEESSSSEPQPQPVEPQPAASSAEPQPAAQGPEPAAPFPPGTGFGGPGQLATLYVGDLAPDVTEMHLHEKFQSFGPIAMIHVCRDSVSRRSLGYAYVNYYSHIDAQQAMDKLNYTDIRGRCCRIMWNKRDRRTMGSQEANIFVKNLDLNIDSRALYDTFSIFGHILSCKVATDVDGTSRGYGFVQYESQDAAKQAIQRVNGMEIGGRTVFVGPFIKRERTASGAEAEDCSIYIRNIPEDWDDTKVQQLFEPFGPIISSLILNGGRSEKRYGFINFKEPEAAKKAIEELNGKDLRSEEEKAAAPEEEDSKKDEEPKEGEGEKKEAGEAGEEGQSPKHSGVRLQVTHYRSRMEKDEARKKPESLGRGGKGRWEGIKLSIGNLPADTTDEKLSALFKEFGEVTDVKAVLDHDTGNCRGYGFIRFATMEQAVAAVQGMHLKEVEPGHSLQVGLAEAKGAGKAGGGYGKGKGGFGLGEGQWKGKGRGKGFGKDFGGKGPGPKGGPLPGMYGPVGPQAQGLAQPMYFPNMPGAAPAVPGKGPSGKGGPMWALAMPPWGLFGHPMAMMQNPGAPFAFPVRPGMPQSLGIMPMPGGVQAAVSQAGSAAPSAAALASSEPRMKKQALGERLYPLVQRIRPDIAGKITGMLLEMEERELLLLLEDQNLLRQKVQEALGVLDQAKPKAGATV